MQEREDGSDRGVNKRVNDALEELLDPTKETEATGINLINRIVRAVGVEIQGLRILKTRRAHSGRVNLSEPSLL